MERRYGLPEDYEPNREPLAADEDGEERYWTDHRIANAPLFQHYVYRQAASLAREHDLGRILDVGSGPGVKARKWLAPAAQEVVLLDRATVEPLADDIFPDAPFLSVDLEEPPDDLEMRFDLIVCADVIEHLIDPTPCISFLHRHVTSEGLIVLSTPERDHLRGPEVKSCDKPAHVREWNRDELASYLEAEGTEILNHLLIPQRELPRHKEMIRTLAPRALWPADWKTCQVVVARPS